MQDVVLHGRYRGLLGIDAVGHGIRQEPINNVLDAAIEGGREEHALPGLGGLTHEARHWGQEAQFGHVVGFVQHGDLDQGEREGPLVEEVFQATGTGNHDVDTVAESSDLGTLVDASED